MIPGACKIRRECNVHQVLFQIIPVSEERGGAIPAVADQTYDGMSEKHPQGLVSDRREYPTALLCLALNQTNQPTELKIRLVSHRCV